MRNSILALLVGSFLFISCRQHKQVKARIFERKELSEQRLLIKYQYLHEGKTYADSAVVPNAVMGNDSIDLIIDPASPGKGLLDLKK